MFDEGEIGMFVVADTNSNFPDSAKEDSQRIVACVNALDGLAQDSLDGGWNFKEMSAYTKKLEQSLANAKAAYVELTNRVSFADNGEAVYVADQQLMSKFDAAFDQA